jgi:hypothetical protein
MTIRLVALGLGSLLVYASALRLDLVNGVGPVTTWLVHLGLLFTLYASAIILVQRSTTSKSAWLVVIGFALLFRLAWLPAGMTALREGEWSRLPSDAIADLTGREVVFDRHLLYDDDAWRYLWEGHVVAHGENPYGLAPLDDAADGLVDAGSGGSPGSLDGEPAAVWDEVRRRVNHGTVPTIYPPLAQASFGVAHLVAPASVLALKGLLVAVDLATIALVAAALPLSGLPAATAIVYAWNPLVVKAVAGSAHLDVLVALALAGVVYCLLRGWRVASAICLGLGIAAKLSPIVLVPFLARRAGWRALAIGTAAALLSLAPFAFAANPNATGLAVFAGTWHFNALPWDLLERAAESLTGSLEGARLVAGAVTAVVLALLLRFDDGREQSFAGVAAAVMGTVVVLGPAVMPWYLLWVLPLATVALAWHWVAFSAAVCLAFLVMIDGRERQWWLLGEYGTLVAAWWFMSGRTARAPRWLTRAGGGLPTCAT